jgi:hypothetical protein
MTDFKRFEKSELIKSRIYFAKIEYKDWLKIPDNFKNRKGNIVKYATKIENNWVRLSKDKSMNDYICSVDVALIDGNYQKITGLIRKGLWGKGMLEIPSVLNVSIYLVKQTSFDQLISILYPVSLKNKSQNNVLECYKELGLSFNSDRLSHGYITEALNIALRGEPRALQDKRVLKKEVELKKAIENFREELYQIDEIKPDHNLFTTGVIAAALIMLSIDSQCINFFKQLNSFQGETKGEDKDPVEALLRILESLKKKKISEGKLQVEICSKTVRAIKAWNAGPDDNRYWLKRLTSIDFLPDVRKMRAIKGIHGIKEL